MGGQAAVYAFRQGLKDGKGGRAMGGGYGEPAYMAPPAAPLVTVVQGNSGGERRVLNQTFHVPTPVTPAEVARYARDADNAAWGDAA